MGIISSACTPGPTEACAGSQRKTLAATHHRLLPLRLHRAFLPRLPSAPCSPPLQHKNEAKAFYAFLSQVYDYVVNPGHWSTEMREEALQPAALEDNPTELQVVDVGGGTGFCTQGIIKAGVPPTNITLIDQSPQQLDKARVKPDLQGVTILEVGGWAAGWGAGGGWLRVAVHAWGLLVGGQAALPSTAFCVQQWYWEQAWMCAPVCCPAPCRATPRTCPLPPTLSTDTSQQAA